MSHCTDLSLLTIFFSSLRIYLSICTCKEILNLILGCFYYRSIGIWASILAHVNACLFFKLSCLTPVHCNSDNWMSKNELNLRSKYVEVCKTYLILIRCSLDRPGNLPTAPFLSYHYIYKLDPVLARGQREVCHHHLRQFATFG